MPSSTIAKVPPFWFRAVVVSPNTSRAEPLKARLTAYVVPFCGMPYDADFSSVPSISDLDSRNFSPSSLQAIRGSLGSSATGAAACPLGGQLNSAYLRSHSSPGFCAQAIGSLTEAPLAVGWGACDAAGAEGWVVGSALGEASTNGAGRGLGVAWLACGVFFLLGLALPEGEAWPDGLADSEGCAAGVPGCGWPATIRNRSWAVRLTESTRLEAFSPGISTMMLRLPWVVTSASATPCPLTRWSTMSAAWLSLVWVTSLSPLVMAESVIRVPPSRSRPSRGFQVWPRAASP